MTAFRLSVMIFFMASLSSLPKTLTVRFRESLMSGIFTYSEYSDVTISRFLQRAAERELARLSRNDTKLKLKLRKVMNGNTTGNNRE